MSNLIEKLTWQQIRKEVSGVNPDLAKAIDEFDPSSSYSIYKLRYPWGQHLWHNGMLHLPNSKGQWVSANDTSIDSKISGDIFYNNALPLGIVLKKSVEFYVESSKRAVPWSYQQEGSIFGLSAYLQDKHSINHIENIANIIAGSRSALLLPKISDSNAFKKLKPLFTLQSPMPQALNDQWPLLNELANHPEFPERWHTEVLYFSKKWLNLSSQKALPLKYYLLDLSWRESAALRNRITFDLAFAQVLKETKLKLNFYLSDTIKHLYHIGQKVFPGYRCADDSAAVPLNGFQKIFNEVYGIRYLPTMIVPGYLENDPLKPLYYSLEIPTLLLSSAKPKKFDHKMQDLREIQHTMQTFKDYLSKKANEPAFCQTPLYPIVREVSFDCYHSDEDSQQEILSTKQLRKSDKHILREEKKFPNKAFCDTSPFLRGCIRIARNKPK